MGRFFYGLLFILASFFSVEVHTSSVSVCIDNETSHDIRIMYLSHRDGQVERTPTVKANSIRIVQVNTDRSHGIAFETDKGIYRFTVSDQQEVFKLLIDNDGKASIEKN